MRRNPLLITFDSFREARSYAADKIEGYPNWSCRSFMDGGVERWYIVPGASGLNTNTQRAFTMNCAGEPVHDDLWLGKDRL